jgi:hypothetical protein
MCATTRMTRSKTSLLNKEIVNEEKQKKIEDLKKDISNLVNIDFAKTFGLNDESACSEEKFIKATQQQQPTEEEGLRKRKSLEKDSVVDEVATKVVDEGVKYSGYLKYTNKNIISILLASLIVIIVFVYITNKTKLF